MGTIWVSFGREVEKSASKSETVAGFAEPRKGTFPAEKIVEAEHLATTTSLSLNRIWIEFTCMTDGQSCVELRAVRNNIILFMISSVAFGLVLSFLSVSVAYLIPSWITPTDILLLSIIALLLIGSVAYRLLVPSLKISETIGCYLVYDTRTGRALHWPTVNYRYWDIADDALGELGKSKTDFKDILTKSDRLGVDIVRDLMLYVTLVWLDMLPMSPLFVAMRLHVGIPPKLYLDQNQEKRTVSLTNFPKLANTFLDVESLRSRVANITIPKSMQFHLAEDRVTIKNRHVSISITLPRGYQLLRGADLRLIEALGLTIEQSQLLASLSTTILFEAHMTSVISPLLRDIDSFWGYASDMLNNLRSEYEWSVVLEDVKEALTWQRLRPSGNKPP